VPLPAAPRRRAEEGGDARRDLARIRSTAAGGTPGERNGDPIAGESPGSGLKKNDLDVEKSLTRDRVHGIKTAERDREI
jgi:hypothetical protein